MRYIKTVSLLTMIMVGMSGVSYGAPMTSQIHRLMQEKEEKIKALEQCDGKRKGWMIAGISTIGLTAVGVGVNIAQASKSNRLSGEIDSAKQELDKQEYTLQNINYEITEKERKKAELERQRQKADCEAREGMWWNPSTEYCEPKLTSPVGSSINILPAPVLDNHPKLGDLCQDGAWIWTEVTGADVPDDAPTCIKEPAGKTPCVCAPKKLELIDALGAKSGGTLSKGDAKLAGLDTHKKSLVSPDLKESDCYKQVEDYLALSCKKCIKQWVIVGPDICDKQIDMHKGYSRIEQGDVVFVNGEPDSTPLNIFAKDGYAVILNCDGACADFDAEDAKKCRISGGEWRYSNQLKKYECHCGTIGSYTDRHMMKTKDNTCVCQSGYVLIDDDQPIKGCRLGSDDVAIDNVIRKASVITNKWNSVSTKVRQCELAAKNVEGAKDSSQAEKYFEQTRQFALETVNLVNDVRNSYTEFLNAYNTLSDNDKRAVARDKASADIIKGDVDSIQSTVDAYVKKAKDNFAHVVETENAKTKAQQKQNDATVLAQKCLDTHGLPNGTSCVCDSKKNLLPDGPNACKCKTVGRNQYEWHEKCSMCRAPNAVDNDLPCGV